MTIPTFELNNGVTVPALGYGVAEHDVQHGEVLRGIVDHESGCVFGDLRDDRGAFQEQADHGG